MYMLDTSDVQIFFLVILKVIFLEMCYIKLQDL